MVRLYIEQNTPEWHQVRSNRIGSSDAATIMNENPYTTPQQLFQIKMGLKQVIQTPAMLIGKNMESEALQVFNSINNLNCVPAVFISDDRPWQMSSLDGIDEKEGIAIEIKCSEKLLQQAQKGIIPIYYQIQIQHHMSVLDLNEMIYFAYYINRHHTIHVERDDDLINKMIEKEKEFWDNLQTFTPPKVEISGFESRDDDAWINAAQQWKICKSELNDAQENEKIAREYLLSLVDKPSIGAGVKISQVIRPGTIKYKDIPDLQHIDFEKYREKPTTYWKIS